MKRVNTIETIHSLMNDKMKIINKVCDDAGIYFAFKLADRMEERNLTVRSLAEITGLRIATISDLMTGKKQSINLHHILVIMIALRITDISELVEISFPIEKIKQYKKESSLWVNEGTVPIKTIELRNFILNEQDSYSLEKESTKLSK